MSWYDCELRRHAIRLADFYLESGGGHPHEVLTLQVRGVRIILEDAGTGPSKQYESAPIRRMKKPETLDALTPAPEEKAEQPTEEEA